jgi:hypothetical protein
MIARPWWQDRTSRRITRPFTPTRLAVPPYLVVR